MKYVVIILEKEGEELVAAVKSQVEFEELEKNVDNAKIYSDLSHNFMVFSTVSEFSGLLKDFEERGGDRRWPHARFTP